MGSWDILPDFFKVLTGGKPCVLGTPLLVPLLLPLLAPFAPLLECTDAIEPEEEVKNDAGDGERLTNDHCPLPSNV